MTRRSLASVALLALMFFPLRPARAALEVTPFIGAMIPAKTQLMLSDGSAYLRMQTHTVYGLTLGTSLNEKAGLEFVLGAGTGKLELVGGTAFELASTVYIADVRGRLRLLGDSQSSLSAVLGVGYTDFSIGLFDLAEETDLGSFIGRATGVAGAEVRSDLSDRVHLNVTLVDRVHDSGVGLNLFGSEVVQKTQNDITVTAGLTFGL